MNGWTSWPNTLGESTSKARYIFANVALLLDGAVGLISIHLAFYQMNPWPTALAAFLIFGTHEFDSGRNLLLFANSMPMCSKFV